jgi:hypothetical protein
MKNTIIKFALSSIVTFSVFQSAQTWAKVPPLNDTTPKILKACNPSNNKGVVQDLCIVYTKGFIEGAKRIDDIFVTHVINERKVRSDFLNRVYQTRVNDRSDKYDLVEKAPFCMSGDENLTEIATSLIQSGLDITNLTSINDSIYNYMTKNYVCTDK